MIENLPTTRLADLDFKFAIRGFCSSLVVLVGLLVAGTCNQAEAGLLTSSANTHEIIRYDLADPNHPATFLTADQGLWHPLGMAFDSNGDLFVHNAYPTPQILRYSNSGQYKGVFTTDLQNSSYLTFGPDGDLYVGDQQAAYVKRYDKNTGALVQSSYVTIPTDMEFLPNGDLLVADAYSNTIVRLQAGTMQYLGVFASGGGLNFPHGIALGPDHNLYVSSYMTNQVKRYDGTTGQFIDNFVSGNGIDRPWDIEFGPDGDLYLANEGTRNVLRFNGTSGALAGTYVNGTRFGLGDGLFLAFDPVPEPGCAMLLGIWCCVFPNWISLRRRRD